MHISALAARLTLLGLVLCVGPSTQESACNGSPDLCSRQFSNVSFIGTHDSAFNGDLPTDNQNVDLVSQLDAGIRFLQAQTHNDLLGQLSMCHTSCLELDNGTLDNYLSIVKTWLDANTDEVVMMLLVNGDELAVGNFSDAFSSTGLDTYAYVPTSYPIPIDSWPTLSDLISSNKRLVMFLDTGADTSVAPYILDEFTHYFETPYDTTDPTFPECSINRPAGVTSATGRMYIVNHFLDEDILGIDIPDHAAANTTNAATGSGSIGAQTDLCVGLYGRYPNGVLVDWFDQGDVFAAQNTMNGLS